jgi:hypothetical protein
MNWVWNTFFANRAAAWQAVCAVVLVVFSGLLWKVSDKANETARENQRAFLNMAGVTPGVTMLGPDNTKRMGQEALVTWANTGTTPARNVIGNTTEQLWQTDLPQGFGFPDLNPHGREPIAIGPRGYTQVSVLVPVNDIYSAGRPGSHIFFWGWAVYDDVFAGDPPRLTEFCEEMIQITLPTLTSDVTDSRVPISWNIQMCKQQNHNCYDEDCPDYSERIAEARKKSL